VRTFNPLHVLGNNISESDIDGLKIFKFYDNPEIRAEIQVMKTVMKYQALAPSSHLRKGRIARGRTQSTYLIGGSIFFAGVLIISRRLRMSLLPSLNPISPPFILLKY
jgi:hypothetical protein